MHRTLAPAMIISLAAMTIMVQACSDDPTGPGSTTATISVDPNPDTLVTPWVVIGSDATIVGHGDSLLSNLVPGTYHMEWGTVPGWAISGTQHDSITLDAGQSYNWSVTYRTRATIAIDTEPNELAAGWTLTGPGGLELNGHGDAEFGSLTSGDYTLHWLHIDGWAGPHPDIVAIHLADGQRVEITGHYARYGQATFEHQPAQVPAAVTITGPRDFEFEGNTPLVLDSLVPGAYTMEWSRYEGWREPSSEPELFTVVEAGDTTITGSYTWPRPFPVVDEAAAYDVLAIGQHVVVVGEGEIRCYDHSNPSALEMVGSVNIGNYCCPRGIRLILHGDEILVTMHERLIVLEIGSDGTLSIVSDTAIEGFSPQCSEVKGQYLFSADWGHMLSVLDLSQLTQPELIAQIDTSWYSYGIALYGDHAYLTHGDAYEGNPWHVAILDISNPSQPINVGELAVNQYWGDWVIVDDLAFALGSATRVYDLGNPLQPQVVAEVDFDMRYCCGNIELANDWAYLFTDYGELRILDISEPASPRSLGTLGGGFMGLAPIGEFIVTTPEQSHQGRLQVFDLQNPPVEEQLGR